MPQQVTMMPQWAAMMPQQAAMMPQRVAMMSQCRNGGGYDAATGGHYAARGGHYAATGGHDAATGNVTGIGATPQQMRAVMGSTMLQRAAKWADAATKQAAQMPQCNGWRSCRNIQADAAMGGGFKVSRKFQLKESST